MAWLAAQPNTQTKSALPVRGGIGRRGASAYRTGWDPSRTMAEGIHRVTWVYRCVDAIASNAARMPIIVREGNYWDGEIVHTPGVDKLTRLFNSRPNPGEDSFAFRYRLSTQLLTSRKGVFIEVVRTRGGEVVKLVLLPPEAVEPIKDPKNFVKGYELNVSYSDGTKSVTDTRTLKPEQVIWIRKPHPYDPYGALTPMEPIGLAVETDWLAKMYNRNFLLNDGRPGGMVVIKGDMDEDDKDEIRARFAGGVQQAGRISVIASEDGADFVDTAVTPRDAQYKESREITKDEILIGFGVPESVLGDAAGRTYDNAEMERLIFWMETMIPHLELITRPLDVLDADDSLYVSYDLSRVDVLQRAEQKKREFLLREVDLGVSYADEYREATGRERFSDDYGQIIWSSKNKIPIATANGVDLPGDMQDLQNTARSAGKPANGTEPVQDEEPTEREGDERLPATGDAENNAPAARESTTKSLMELDSVIMALKSAQADHDRWALITSLGINRVLDRQKRIVLEKADGRQFRKVAFRDTPADELTAVVADLDMWVKQILEDIIPTVRGAYAEAARQTAEKLCVEPEATDTVDIAPRLAKFKAHASKHLDGAMFEFIQAGRKLAVLPGLLEKAMDDIISDGYVEQIAAEIAVDAYETGKLSAIETAGVEKVWVGVPGSPINEMLNGKVLDADGLFQVGVKTIGLAPHRSDFPATLLPIEDGIPLI